MGLQPTREVIAGEAPVFQNVFETASGGFSLDTTGLSALAPGSVLKAGTPVGFDESTRKARVIKLAKLTANAANNATQYQVEKGHSFIVGEFVGYAIGGAAYAISSIDTTNPDYDVITLATTLGVAITAPAALFQSAASGASAAALIVSPRGLLLWNVDAKAGETVTVVIRGTVYARRVPITPTAIRNLMPTIIYSESF